MSKIAIIGSGLVGRSWAVSFARAGHDAFLWDSQDGAAEAAIGLAILVVFYRNRGSIAVEDINLMKG